MNQFLKFHCLPFHVKWMLVEAMVLSAYYRTILLNKPFSKISPSIGTVGKQTSMQGFEKTEEGKRQRELVKEVAWAVDEVCNRTPWESKCLVRALVAKKMLNRRKCSCTLYMGVMVDETSGMVAHAWLRCEDIFVTGGTGKGYTVTTIYGD